MPILGDDDGSGTSGESLKRKAKCLTKNSDRDAMEWECTQKSLQEALVANRELQAKILSELARIAERKRDNRLEAERVIERSCIVVLAGDITQSTSGLPPTATASESESKQASAVNGDDLSSHDANQKKKNGKKKIKRAAKGEIGYIPTNDDINELLAFDLNTNGDKDDDEQTEGHKIAVENVDKDKNKNKKWSLCLRKKFLYDPYRKWTSEYFIDPTGSRPKENEDMIRRRKLMMKRKPTSNTDQHYEEDQMVPDTFFYHTSQPFTWKEKAFLDKWLLQDNNNNKCFDEGGSDSNSFYDSIAQKLREEHHENPASRRKDRRLMPTCLPRSAEDIRLYHRHRLASQYEFTKEESLAILEGVEETTTAKEGDSLEENHCEESTVRIDHGNNESNVRRRNQAIRRPNWQMICSKVLEVHRRSHSGSAAAGSNNGDRGIVRDRPPITPYQCMVHYKTKLRPRPDGSFTPEEDELFLRYIAAMGPQFVWGYPEITNLASRLFPHKTSKRIFERTHFSQWHPLSKDTIWTKEEEQKLVILMKIYSETESEGVDTIDDCDDDDEARNSGEGISEQKRAQTKQTKHIAMEKAALHKAAEHFHPYRQHYKVLKKWGRSFSPRFCYKPFSKEEDARLLAAVRSSAGTMPFSEIAKQNFPDRSCDQLSTRWARIAPDKDKMKKAIPSMVRSGLKKGLVSTNSRNKTLVEKATNDVGVQDRNSIQTGEDRALFDPSDFVVELLGNKSAGGQNE